MSKRYGRNQKRKHREIIKNLENKRIEEKYNARKREDELRDKVDALQSLDYQDVNHHDKVYLSPTGRRYPYQDAQERKIVNLKKLVLRRVILKDELLEIRNGNDYLGYIKEEMRRELLYGIQEYLSFKQSDERGLLSFQYEIVIEQEEMKNE